MTEEEKLGIIRGIEKSLSEDIVLLERARHSADLHKQYMEALKKIQPGTSFPEFEELAVLNDFHAYTLFSLLDLYVTVKNLLVAKTNWERIYFVKHGYLIVHEALETYYAHNTALYSLLRGQYPAMLGSHTIIADEIKAYGHKHGYPKKMKDIRNSIIAHIETDFAKYFDSIRGLNGEAAMEAIVSFMVVLKHLQEFLGSFVSDANKHRQEENLQTEKSIGEYKKKIEDFFEKSIIGLTQSPPDQK